jgi:hypothetical protein
LQGRRFASRCCYFQFSADGESFIFASAAGASEDRLTAAMNVVVPVNLQSSEKPKENIARQKRGRRTTVKQKTAVGMG